LNSGLKDLCTSVEMKLSISCRRTRSKLAAGGASFFAGAWSARYWTMAGPSVSTSPLSSTSAGT
jgi:hypothetical protein